MHRSMFGHDKCVVDMYRSCFCVWQTPHMWSAYNVLRPVDKIDTAFSKYPHLWEALATALITTAMLAKINGGAPLWASNVSKGLGWATRTLCTHESQHTATHFVFTSCILKWFDSHVEINKDRETSSCSTEVQTDRILWIFQYLNLDHSSHNMLVSSNRVLVGCVLRRYVSIVPDNWWPLQMRCGRVSSSTSESSAWQLHAK